MAWIFLYDPETETIDKSQKYQIIECVDVDNLGKLYSVIDKDGNTHEYYDFEFELEESLTE
jgi:hypothetical protein